MESARRHRDESLLHSSRAPFPSPFRVRDTEALTKRLQKRARALAEEVEHVERMAGRQGSGRAFGAATDKRYLRNLVVTEMQIQDTGHGTAVMRCTTRCRC
jgi:hypothetical protein